MEIPSLFGIDSADILDAKLREHVNSITIPVGIEATISKQRVLEAYGAWRNDLKRSSEHSFQKQDTIPDHFKCAAHLTYWMRRCSPIISLRTSLQFSGEVRQEEMRGNRSLEPTSMYSMLGMIEMESEFVMDANSLGELQSLKDDVLLKSLPLQLSELVPITKKEILDHRRRLFAYSNEYIAFDYGFRLCKTYELLRTNRHDTGFSPNVDYVDTICYFLKFKNVSPHAIFLIFKSLLLDRFDAEAM